jgi:Flp pilus assembly protein TadB
MLDDADRETLAETERQLARSDPHLDALLRSGHARRRRAVAVATWLVGVVGTLLVVALLWLGLGGQACLVALMVALVLGRRRARALWQRRRS